MQDLIIILIIIACIYVIFRAVDSIFDDMFGGDKPGLT